MYDQWWKRDLNSYLLSKLSTELKINQVPFAKKIRQNTSQNFVNSYRNSSTILTWVRRSSMYQIYCLQSIWKAPFLYEIRIKWEPSPQWDFFPKFISHLFHCTPEDVLGVQKSKEVQESRICFVSFTVF